MLLMKKKLPAYQTLAQTLACPTLTRTQSQSKFVPFFFCMNACLNRTLSDEEKIQLLNSKAKEVYIKENEVELNDNEWLVFTDGKFINKFPASCNVEQVKSSIPKQKHRQSLCHHYHPRPIKVSNHTVILSDEEKIQLLNSKAKEVYIKENEMELNDNEWLVFTDGKFINKFPASCDVEQVKSSIPKDKHRQSLCHHYHPRPIKISNHTVLFIDTTLQSISLQSIDSLSYARVLMMTVW